MTIAKAVHRASRIVLTSGVAVSAALISTPPAGADPDPCIPNGPENDLLRTDPGPHLRQPLRRHGLEFRDPLRTVDPRNKVNRGSVRRLRRGLNVIPGG